MHSIGAYTFRLVMAGLIVGMSTGTAFAYLDPGTGSIILQVLLGGVAGLLLAGKLYWHRLLIMLGIRREEEVASTSNAPQDVQIDAATRK
ncbi:hypothetical protein [Geminicoccus flavidas]|uniref:hypothetical protein n=1 Tax=Geminicoccus flavidas TaxID=2506407 RepID=UPI00135A8FEA|nr:hypothetical protein [Geminicoccus flavidas]